jgi:hypothetical protein
VPNPIDGLMTMAIGASQGGATMMRPTLIARSISCERAAQFSSATSNGSNRSSWS